MPSMQKQSALRILFLLLSFPTWTVAQQGGSSLASTRVLIDSEIGGAGSLGYKFPHTAFGTSAEIPLGHRFELQGGISVSPDKKIITNDGHSMHYRSSGIVWVRPNFGVQVGIERSWLWTSQFSKQAWFPSIGIVYRDEITGPGRLYISYVFPTGCVWATSTNPCKIQSNRLQGLEGIQEFRVAEHMRLGFKIGYYHFCDQGNPLGSNVSRNCHFGGVAAFLVRFEIKRVTMTLPY